MKNISKRIKNILSLIDKCDILYDVGCDHGQLGISALNLGITKHVVFSDISLQSLEKAKLLAEKHNKLSNSQFVVSDGLKEVNYIKGAVVIAGMGGEEIIKIISNLNYLVEQLICQPMKNVNKLRLYLIHNGYKIIEDKVIKIDKMFYWIIKSEPGKQILTDIQINYGINYYNDNSEDFIDYLKFSKNQVLNITAKEHELENINKLLENNFG